MRAMYRSTTISTTGVILAGGQSSRMGRDKALLTLPSYQEHTFVKQLVLVLAACCDDVVLVARDIGHAATYASYVPSTVQLVTDLVPDVGPLMGLYSGLRAVGSNRAFVTAVDTPLLRAALVTFLLAQSQDEDLLVPMVEGLPQVLLAVYSLSVLPLIEERLQAGRRDPRSLLEVARVYYVEEAHLRTVDPELHSFININTQADLSALF